MGVVQVSLEQVLSALKESLQSIDLRAAVIHAGNYENVFTGIRVSSRSASEVEDRHRRLLESLGPGEAGSFEVLYGALPFSCIDEVLQELQQGTLTIADKKISLSRGINVSSELRGDIQRNHGLVRHWGSVPNSAFLSSRQLDIPKDRSGLLADIRRVLGVRSVGGSIDAFLELNDAGRSSVHFFTYVEMPARITHVSLAGRTLKTEIAVDKRFGRLRLCANLYASSGGRLLESQFPDFQLVSDHGPSLQFRTEAVFGSIHDSDFLECVLTHEQLPEIDEVNGRALELMQAEERNPLLESLRKFWDINKLYEQAVQPFLTKRTKVDVGPQDVFQKAIARLLNLAGFQAIDLERQDRIYHAETKVERATLDLLAYHPSEKILLLGACTIGVPKTEDYEKLLHAREIFKASLTPEIPIYIAPVLFTMQENVSPFRTDMATAGLHMLNTRDLEALTRLIDAGKEVKFIYFFKSPIATVLADMS